MMKKCSVRFLDFSNIGSDDCVKRCPGQVVGEAGGKPYCRKHIRGEQIRLEAERLADESGLTGYARLKMFKQIRKELEATNG